MYHYQSSSMTWSTGFLVLFGCIRFSHHERPRVNTYPTEIGIEVDSMTIGYGLYGGPLLKVCE